MINQNECLSIPTPIYAEFRREHKHKSFRDEARCFWPDAASIEGEGRYAILAWCGRLTITLHEELAPALEAKRKLDASGYGERCSGGPGHRPCRVEYLDFDKFEEDEKERQRRRNGRLSEKGD